MIYQRGSSTFGSPIMPDASVSSFTDNSLLNREWLTSLELRKGESQVSLGSIASYSRF